VSGYSPKWRRILQRYASILFRVCGAGNYHWRRDRVCYCNGNAVKLRDGDSREWMLAEQRDRWQRYACKWEAERHRYRAALELIAQRDSGDPEDKRIAAAVLSTAAPFVVQPGTSATPSAPQGPTS
jgi:hypothetical protein